MKLQHWFIVIQYMPGAENGLADALSREERQCETGYNNGFQSGPGGCDGVLLTVERKSKHREDEPVRET